MSAFFYVYEVKNILDENLKDNSSEKSKKYV